MRVIVFGATGRIGSRVVAEAVSRGHDVTGVVRDEAHRRSLPSTVTGRLGDAGSREDVAELIAAQDLVVAATRPSPGQEPDLIATTRTLLAETAAAQIRLLIVGGAATLTVPGTSRTLHEGPDYPAALRDIAKACTAQLEICRAETEADWTYLSPPALLKHGDRTGRYRLGSDELLMDAAGVSTISTEDLAVALLDEAERPRHRRTRFTVADAVDEAGCGNDS